MLNIAILSKDRACQLDFLLRSLAKIYIPIQTEINILYTYSSPFFKEGYDKLINEYTKNYSIVKFHKQKNFRQDFLNLIGGEYVLGLTDDTVFYRKLRLDSLDFLKEAFCFSCRLGKNTYVQDCESGKYMCSVRAEESNDMLRWDWTLYSQNYNWGYPVSFDGHIYDGDFLREISNTDWHNLRTWEGNIIGHVHDFKQRNVMYSPKNSVCVNIPTNIVQKDGSAGSKYPVDEGTLNKMYINGVKISNDTLNVEIVGSHQQIKLEFE